LSDNNILVINDWTLYAHPLFLEQLALLTDKVNALKVRDPFGYKKKNATKRLAAIEKLIFEGNPPDSWDVLLKSASSLIVSSD